MDTVSSSYLYGRSDKGSLLAFESLLWKNRRTINVAQTSMLGSSIPALALTKEKLDPVLTDEEYSQLKALENRIRTAASDVETHLATGNGQGYTESWTRIYPLVREYSEKLSLMRQKGEASRKDGMDGHETSKPSEDTTPGGDKPPSTPDPPTSAGPSDESVDTASKSAPGSLAKDPKKQGMKSRIANLLKDENF